MIKVEKIFMNKYVSINEQRYFFITYEQKRFVIPDRCPHKGGPLSLGMTCIEKNTVQCPWHDSSFRLEFLVKKAIPSIRVKNELFYL